MLGYGPDGRPLGDFYATPPIAIEKLLEHENFHEDCWEPCCGDGAISDILIARGFNVYSSDLYDWGYGETGIDFLKTERDTHTIISNAPYKLATEFAYHALSCTKKYRGKVAFLNRLQFLEGIKR